MLEPLDRCRRHSTLFQFTSERLRDFIDPNHLLIQIDEQLDFAKLVAPLEQRNLPDFGWPAIHPEATVRALLDLQHCFLPQIVLGHLGEYLLSLVLLPHHRRPGVRPFHHHPLHQPRRTGGILRGVFGLNAELLRMGLLPPTCTRTPAS